MPTTSLPLRPQAPGPRLAIHSESMIEAFTRRGLVRDDLNASASEPYTLAERQQAELLRQLIAAGTLAAGTIIPHRLMPLVYGHALPQSVAMDASWSGGTASTHDRLARKVEASMDAALAQPYARRDVAQDHREVRRGDAGVPTMSYKLQQVLADVTPPIDEAQFEELMTRWYVTDTLARIALKTEGHACGMVKLRGTSTPPALAPSRPALEATRSGQGLTLTASADGYAPDETSIWVDDPADASGLTLIG